MHQLVSAVFVIEREEDGHKFPLQKPVYYVSTVLTHANLDTLITKNSIRCLHGIPEATTLLSRVFD